MLSFRTCSLIACTLAASAVRSSAELSLSLSFSGVAKSAATGDFAPNACGYEEFSTQFVSAAESRFAYVSPSFWDTDNVCGRCANVTLSPAEDPANSVPNSTVTVMLISKFDDECGDSSDGEDDCQYDLLLSDQAYRDMLNQGTGSRFGVDWTLVECPSDFVDGGIEFAFDDATTTQLLTVQPRNFHGQIAALGAQFSDGARFPFGAPGENTFGSFRSVVVADGKHNFSQPFTLVASQEHSLTTIEVNVTEAPVPNLVLVTDEQF